MGLGKTIEAGLVIQELFLRHRARTAIIVCPAGLCLKWQDEMDQKFGLRLRGRQLRDDEARCGAATDCTPTPSLSSRGSSSRWPGCPASGRSASCGTPSAARPNGFAFDILVVDEAHHVAPSSPARTDKVGLERRGYAVDSQRTRAVRDLAERAEHRLFLSATPHNGYTESFTALLEMIDPQRFVRSNKVDAKALQEVAVRRLKRDLREAKGFQEREVKALRYTASADEAEAYERLLAFTQRRDRAVADTPATRSAKDMATLLLKKRFFSSPVAFARTIDVYKDTRTRGLAVDFEADYDEILGFGADDLEEGKVDQPELQTLQEAKGALPALTDEDLDGPRLAQRLGSQLRGPPRQPAGRPPRPL